LNVVSDFEPKSHDNRLSDREKPQEQARRFVLEKPAGKHTGHASIGKRKQPINS
jgi:hypothetical protein